MQSRRRHREPALRYKTFVTKADPAIGPRAATRWQHTDVVADHFHTDHRTTRRSADRSTAHHNSSGRSRRLDRGIGTRNCGRSTSPTATGTTGSAQFRLLQRFPGVTVRATEGTAKLMAAQNDPAFRARLLGSGIPRTATRRRTGRDSIVDEHGFELERCRARSSRGRSHRHRRDDDVARSRHGPARRR